jgi:hypothetical protein
MHNQAIREEEVTHHNAEPILLAVAKLAPPVTVVVTAAAGVDWQALVWQLTALYTAIMITKMVWDWLVKPWIKPKKAG